MKDPACNILNSNETKEPDVVFKENQDQHQPL